MCDNRPNKNCQALTLPWHLYLVCWSLLHFFLCIHLHQQTGDSDVCKAAIFKQQNKQVESLPSLHPASYWTRDILHTKQKARGNSRKQFYPEGIKEGKDDPSAPLCSTCLKAHTVVQFQFGSCSTKTPDSVITIYMKSLGIQSLSSSLSFPTGIYQNNCLISIKCNRRREGQSPSLQRAEAQPSLVQPIFQRAAATPCGKFQHCRLIPNNVSL